MVASLDNCYQTASMYSTLGVLLCAFALFAETFAADDHALESCLQRDSISCVQIHIYKKLKAILSQRTIELLGGFRIVRNKTETDPAVPDVESNAIDGKMYNALGISERQLILEDFIYNKVLDFFKHRRLQWNFGVALKQVLPTARKLFNGISDSMKEKFMNYVTEGRGKKKFMRLVVPVIIAFKMTVFTWVKVIYLGIALIAKKALIISIIALVVAIFVAVKKHSYKEYRQPHYEIHGETIHSVPYYPVSWPSGGHSVHSGHDSYDMHASGSSPAHYLAYAAQKPSYS